MSDVEEQRFLARTASLLDAFRKIATGEHVNVVAEAAVALLAEALANHPDRKDMLEHVLEQLPSLVEEIASGELEGRGYKGSA